MRWIVREWRRLWPYFTLLDFGAKPSTKISSAVRILVIVFGIVVLAKRYETTTAVLVRSKHPMPIPNQEIEDYRFRLPERTRREIFTAIAENEANDRATALQKNTWNGHLWSREDDRGHFERVFERGIAAKYKISLTQAYLILDEGIREKWPGPDGKPLTATTPPFDPRQTW